MQREYDEADTTPQQLARIAGFIWGIADDVLRDLYVRGKYRDVILPMTVLRRFDAVLEPTKQAVLEMKAFLDKQGIVDQDGPLRQRRRPGRLQHVEVHAARPPLADEPAAAAARLRGLPRRLLAERAGDPRRVRVPQPDPAALEGRRDRLADREVPRPVDQPQPAAGLNGDGASSTPASTTTRWARCSRSSSAASTRRTTRRPASTGRRATRSS